MDFANELVELKKLSRKDLLEILVEQGERIEDLEKKLYDAETELKNRSIAIEQAGSIAEASLRLNRVFEAADAAVEQYVESIKLLNREQETILAKRESASKEQASQLLTKARSESSEMVEKARRESEAYWNNAQEKVRKLVEAHSDVLKLSITERRSDTIADETEPAKRPNPEK